MKLKDIRNLFLDYFKRNGHEVLSSSALVPHNDPSLMFTNSGMVQFKNYFTGAEKRSSDAPATTVQKCVRAGGKHNDLENVGDTPRHHTFFEMLGNFSFGQYFKEGAISMAWDLLTKEFGLNKERLYVTVFHEDTEATKLWQKIAGFKEDRIIPISTMDNFWSMGETGPCGPCSEIFYDHGDQYQGGLPGTPEQDGNRYVEIWNLVFMQYEDQLGRVRSNLPTPAIDTGMGLERMAAVLQGKNNNFDTDLFQTLIASAATVTNCYEIGKSHRVIADHIRAIGFLIADGIMPSNEGRGYVLRRIMRRAMRHAYHLGLRDPGLFKIIPVLVSEMSDAYPELSRAHGTMSTILQLEEERFIKTLDHGMKLLTEESASISSGGKLAGDIAFKLYDTYGFPIDLTSDALSAKGISVDTDSFDACMQKQKQMARAAWNGSGETAQQQLWLDLAATKDATDFIGYLHEKATALITAIVQDGKSINEASSGDCIVLLNQTPFYAESGGQVGDVGTLTNSTGTSIVVADTKKYAAVLHGHHVKIPHGITLKVGDAVTAAIDASTRQDTKCNHSATHLLHNALRSTLGEHVVQKGSWVGPQRLRFDFAHTKALSADEINMVEKIVNKMVITNLPTGTVVMSFDEAVASGAIALFGEKYTSDVRVISMGESMELCGGTHVKNTGAIGLFKIVSEESVSFGIRRIEAVTGMSAIHFVNDYQQKVHQICATAKCQPATAVHKVESLVNEVRQLQKTCAEQRVALALHHPLESMSYGDIHLYMLRIGELDASESKMLIAELQQRCGDNSVVMLTIAMESKSTIMLSIGKQLVGRVDAREIARRVAAASGGGGGGRPELAQVGGVDSNKLSGALSALEEYIKEC